VVPTIIPYYGQDSTWLHSWVTNFNLPPFHSSSSLYTTTLFTFTTHNNTTLFFSSLLFSSSRTWEWEPHHHRIMESPDISPPHVDASRPSLGFPLGTALLLIIIFTLSGVLSCCYHWDRIRSLRQSFSHSDPQMHSDSTKSKPSTVPIYLSSHQTMFFFFFVFFLTVFVFVRNCGRTGDRACQCWCRGMRCPSS